MRVNSRSRWLRIAEYPGALVTSQLRERFPIIIGSFAEAAKALSGVAA
jgi:hypothetical protein